MTEPWDKQPGETSRAYAAFLAYRDLGAHRSLSKTAKLQPKPGPLSTLKEWSAKFRWGHRAEKYDEHLRREADAVRLEAVKEATERHTRLARALTVRVAGRLNAMDASELAIADIPRWLDIAVKIERLGLGLATTTAAEGPKDAETLDAELRDAKDRLAAKLADVLPPPGAASPTDTPPESPVDAPESVVDPDQEPNP